MVVNILKAVSWCSCTSKDFCFACREDAK